MSVSPGGCSMAKFWFVVRSHRTGGCCDVIAASAEAACRSRGWAVDDCTVLQVAQLPDYLSDVGTPAPPDDPKVSEPAARSTS